MAFPFASAGELSAGFQVAEGEAADANRDVELQFARLLDIDAVQLTVKTPNFLMGEIEITITASSMSDVHTAVLEASLVEQLKVSGFEFSYHSETFLISADCGEYNVGTSEGAAAGCGNAVGCLWSLKDLACASPRDDVSTSIAWAAPEIQVGPKSQATTQGDTNDGQLVMIIVVIVGLFVLAGIAFMYVRRKKSKVLIDSPSYKPPMTSIEVKNAAYDETIEAIEVTDNTPVVTSSGAISYSYGETQNVDIDRIQMSDETVFEYGVVPQGSSASPRAKNRNGNKKKTPAVATAWNVGDFDELSF